MLRVIVLVFLSSLSISLSAQNEFHEKVIQINLITGAPLFSDYTEINASERTASFSVGGSLSFDFSVIKKFSLGFGFAYQKFNRTLVNHRYALNGISSVEDAELTINAFNSYSRALWHFYQLYETSAHKLDLYVGGGIGIIAYHYQSDSPSSLIQDFDNEDYTGAFGIVGV